LKRKPHINVIDATFNYVAGDMEMATVHTHMADSPRKVLATQKSSTFGSLHYELHSVTIHA